MGETASVVCYGWDGPAFERACPSCGRFMRFPDQMKWKERLDGTCAFPKVECSKCGEVSPNQIGIKSVGPETSNDHP